MKYFSNTVSWAIATSYISPQDCVMIKHHNFLKSYNIIPSTGHLCCSGPRNGDAWTLKHRRRKKCCCQATTKKSKCGLPNALQSGSKIVCATLQNWCAYRATQCSDGSVQNMKTIGTFACLPKIGGLQRGAMKESEAAGCFVGPSVFVCWRFSRLLFLGACDFVC